MSSVLKVSSIQDPTNSNTALSIDTSGRVTTPARPAFSGTHITASGNTGLTGTVIMNTEDFDIGGNYDNSTGIYTVPVTGIYRYSFSGFASSNIGGTTTGQKTVSLQTNASGSFVDYQGMTGNAHETGPNSDLKVYIPLPFSGLISATAGNQLRIQTIDSNTHIFATVSAVSPYRPRFSIELVG